MSTKLNDDKKREFTQIAGHGATLFFIISIIIQLLLATGVLPVTMSWGGTQTVLTPNLKIASILASIILVFFAISIRRRARGFWINFVYIGFELHICISL